MPSVVRMPEVLANASEAVIQVWLVSVGQTISVGDPLAEVETEKAVVELAAEVEGILARLIAEPGTAIGVGEPIAVVLAPGETDADIDPNLLADATTRDPESASPVLEAAPAPGLELEAETQPDPGVPSTASHSTNDRRLFATPLVRKLARERGIDLETVLGTGPGGRIVRRDLDKLQAEQPTPVAVPTAKPSTPKPHRTDSAGFTDIPLTGMRKAIARRLTESKSTVPHFYLKADCRVDALVDLRRSVNDAATVRVSLNDFILKAVAGALIEVPEANTTWSDDTLRRLDGADVAVAIAVEGGLLTPVLRGVDGMSLSTVATRVAELAQRARTGRIQQQELEGGSFSVSNLGMYGVTEFSAILNPPQSGILAVGSATQRPVAIDGELAVATVMTVTLSADHRVVDGAVAAQWMAAFVRRMENPLTILT